MPYEKDITQAIIDWIQENGGDAHKIHGSLFQRKGEPDIDAALPYGGIIYHLKIEVKRKDGKPTYLQILRLRKYHTLGYVAGIVTSINELETLINAYHNWKADKPFLQVLSEYNIEDKYGIYSKDPVMVTPE